MYTEKAINNAEACRFCWMCRNVCPVGLATGKEASTPRGRGLLVSMDTRGMPMTQETAEIIYHCCLCGACTNDCVTGYDPKVFIREARTEAIINDCVPLNIEDVIKRMKEDHLLGECDSPDLAEYIGNIPEKADILVLLGECARKRQPKVAIALMELLKIAGIDFCVLRQEQSSGAALGDLIGFVDEVRLHAKSFLDSVKNTGAKKIVVLDPSDASFLLHECTEWGIFPDCEIVTATSYVAALVREKKLKPRNIDVGIATFHDPCRLARDLDETEPAREIIASMGIKLKEMISNRKLTKCCGSMLLHETYPDIGRKTALERIKDAKYIKADLMITACPVCQERFQGAGGISVENIFSLLLQSCR